MEDLFRMLVRYANQQGVLGHDVIVSMQATWTILSTMTQYDYCHIVRVNRASLARTVARNGRRATQALGYGILMGPEWP